MTEPHSRADLEAVRVVVVGIGADGWDGLSDAARRSLSRAEVVLGSTRQLTLLPASIAARREEWPSPLVPALPEILSRSAGLRICVLASGDPMFYGIGGTLIRLLGAAAVDVIVHPSSVSLACARLGWPLEEVEVITAVGRPLSSIVAALQPGRRLLVLVGDASAGSSIAELLVGRGFGGSVVTALSRLGASDEAIVADLARDWAGDHDPLTVVAIQVRPDSGAISYGRTPGLPDEAFEHDGQLTKQEIRSMTLSVLAPNPGELLWDIGAGSGSIGIEWMRCHPSNRAIGIERDPERAGRAQRNAERLGVPGWQLVVGAAPDSLAALPTPDAIFVGGAVSRVGVIDAALSALRPGGRLVANGVTVETEATLAGWHAKLGGNLIRVAIARAGPIGAFTGWRPAMPVTQWSYRS